MLDINYIKNNFEKVKKGVGDKGYDPTLIDRVLEINEKRIKIINQVDLLRQERNNLKKDDIEQGRKIKEQLKNLEPELTDIENKLNDLLAQIPNIPSADVPTGKNESENVVIKKWGEPTNFNFKPKDHATLGEILDIVDTGRAGKVSGSRFGYLKNEGVILEFALVKLAFDKLSQAGFVPVIPPVLINKDVMVKMGYMERKNKEEMYELEKDNLVLVGTSEQSIGPIHMDEVLNINQLPTRYIGFSTCFRREAGSYGKDTRGILRAHQFNKTEMFVFTKPEDSEKEHEFLLAKEEELMQLLGLPYQIVKMCTGDLGFTAAKKFDIEAWFPSEGRFRETHSTSNVTDFQARSLNIKYQTKEGLAYVHTLNGTAFSERPILAILENYQLEDGTVKIPEVLIPYTNFSEIKPKKLK